jgi:hypothetical protein
MFGRRAKQNPSLADFKRAPPPDADGVQRVLPKDLWDDPKIGSMLRECGFEPDDPRNIRPTVEHYYELFLASQRRLAQRVEAFNAEMAARHGWCCAKPFLVIDIPIWDGEHGAFLYAALNLVPFDDWNVLMLATDVRTREACGMAGHFGQIPELTEAVTKCVVDWKQRYEVALDAYGVTATLSQGRGITREQYEAEKDAIRQGIVDHVGWMKPQIISQLERVKG